MLQFLTTKSDRYSIAEETQMAIEGGCRWVQITNSLPEGVTMRDAVAEIMPLCQENETFLMIDSDVELAKETRVHGVHLKKGDMLPAEAREELGPHAVIGVDAVTADDILALKGKDIDYAVLEYNNEIGNVVSTVRNAGYEIPIVARGNFTDKQFRELLNAGVSGFAVSSQISDAENPVKATAEILEILTK